MKKFISMVMAAAMVVSLVPATAFAAAGTVTSDGTAYVMGAIEAEEDFNLGLGVGHMNVSNAAEVQIEIDDVKKIETTTPARAIEFDVRLDLENAEFSCHTPYAVIDDTNFAAYFDAILSIEEGVSDYKGAKDATTAGKINWEISEWDTDYVVYTFYGDATVANQLAGAIITFDMCTIMDDTDEGEVAKVSVTSDIVGADAEGLVFAEVLSTGLTVSIKEVTEIGVESDVLVGKEIKIKSSIDKITTGKTFELELSNGFEFNQASVTGSNYTIVRDVKDYDKAVLTYTGTPDVKEIKIAKETLSIESVDAEAGDECYLTVDADKDTTGFNATAETVIVKCVEDAVLVSVDEDEDVPVMYSGVNAENDGLTEGNEEHWSLVVTVEEGVVDAWDFKKAFDITLPDGVYVTDIEVKDVDNVVLWGTSTDVLPGDGTVAPYAEKAFVDAYVKGDQENFEFGRKIMDAKEGEKAKIEFQLELVAEPTFTGDVVLGMAGQEVVIANFVAPYTVEAAQNDLIIDYRNTEVPTDIVIKEAEAGLWNNATGEDTFEFVMDKYIEFDSTPDVDVNEESDMEIKTTGTKFEVVDKSDDEAAVVTVSGIELYMNRSLAAGAYDLFLTSDMLTGFVNEDIVGADTTGPNYDKVSDVTDVDDFTDGLTTFYAHNVKEGFINVITAGRDQDDASFTKKVVVPVGEAYIVAGEETVTLDVPAYVSAAGYTMLPVRAVAVALGINNNNVLWDQATKTVTILYGQRIITMTVGAKVINVNGSAIPASASVEVVDGRTFLPMRDLATALGVTDITWDAATKTATLNGNK